MFLSCVQYIYLLQLQLMKVVYVTTRSTYQENDDATPKPQ